MRGPRLALGSLLLVSSVLLIQAAHQAEVSHIHAGSSVEHLDEEHVQTLAAVQQLTKELLEDGAEVNVEIRPTNLHAGLGMFALRNIKAGETIASVPTDRGVKALAQHGVVDFLLDFVLDLYNPGSPRALMYATMPKPHQLRHQLNFPQQYLPLLQHKELEEWMGPGLHGDVKAFYEMHKAVLSDAGIGYDDVAHALGLLGTRTFSQPTEDGSASIYYALPLLDMANHDNTCPHYNMFQPCAFDETRECAFFVAGADIPAGQEVCLWYGYLLPDRAFLEYGFLPKLPAAKPAASKARKHKAPAAKAAEEAPAADAPAKAEEASEAASKGAKASNAAAGKAAAAASGAAAPAATRRRRVRRNRAAEVQVPALPLFGIDRHDYHSAEPLVKLEAEPRPFTGNLNSITARIESLQKLHETLKAGDALAAELKKQGPAPEDKDGAFLKQVLEWRLQRQRAVVAEVERLQKIKTGYQIRGALSKAARRRK